MEKKPKKTFKILKIGEHGYTLGDEENPILVDFKNRTFTTSNPEIISAIEQVIKDETERGIPLANRKFLTQDEFDEHVTPEKQFVHYEDETGDYNIHIRNIREIIGLAVKNGIYDLTKMKPVIVENISKSKIGKGTMTGAIAK